MKILEGVSSAELWPLDQTPSPLQRSQNSIRRLCPDEKAATLVGKTISPETAFQMRERVTVDSRGMITKVHAKHLSSRNFTAIAGAITSPLTHRPQPADELIRTPKEVLLALTLAVAESALDAAVKTLVIENMKASWLGNKSSKEITQALIEQLQLELSSEPEKNQALKARIETISATLEKEFYITKRNDNYYGRLFDTAFSEYVINNPTPESRHINEMLTRTLLTDFKSYPLATQLALCADIHQRMRADPPGWREQIRESQKFLHNPEPQNFAAMLQSSDPYAIALTLSLAVKYMLAAPNLRPLTDVATQHYANVITDQRQLIKSIKNRNFRSDQYGLLLPYQSVPHQQTHLPGTLGIRPIDRYQPATLGITPHNRAALEAERSMGIGMSGSTNLLNHLFKNLAQEGQVFSMEHAKTLTAAYLTFSGGHSLNEAYTVFSYDDKKDFTPLCFNQLASADRYNAEAVDHAYQKVLEACKLLNT
ncbi:hypothetical protein C4J98_5043 [Pseudomonas orientalis]|uniref:hypothetical protein n=1 Tax=Pseudomonas orientalis TaxID=76758 RepID=UPI000F569AE5|nr:hypothetical protein [Pseudomonas orientalis]AZE86408.1 hypothetical protein C4J98_5043 [Pseudomonas orientalis]